ncbi:hypothetical protein [Rubritalea marina]|uniref:hypothetical protein n=1 Tax=Rubritalea marina TaxID=361055 RepID=UPI000379082E|nr:hypothetical protein [Rubritalea marina]
MESEINRFEEFEAYKAGRAFRMRVSQHILTTIAGAKEFSLADQLPLALSQQIITLTGCPKPLAPIN